MVMELKKKHLTKLLEFSLKIVKKSEQITMKYFGSKFKHKLKENKSPVTEADIKCEKFLIKKILNKFPGHNILGEETGSTKLTSEFRWIIDPIDGTRNFMRNYPFWGTLLALEYDGEVVLGVISMPALKEVIYAAKGLGCRINGKKVKVSTRLEFKDSYLIHGGMEYISRQAYKDKFMQLAMKFDYARGFGDCHGHTLIIKGMAEVLIDPIVKPYDIAASKICLEEAGGILTDINGNATIYNGTAVLSNGALHQQVISNLMQL